MDIEGAEYNLLQKIIRSNLHLKIDRIIVETHAKKIPGLQKKDNKLRKIIKDKGITNIDLNWY